jgi:hypothetical protein
VPEPCHYQGCPEPARYLEIDNYNKDGRWDIPCCVEHAALTRRLMEDKGWARKWIILVDFDSVPPREYEVWVARPSVAEGIYKGGE